MSNTRAALRHPERHRRRDGVMLAWCHPGAVAGVFCDGIAGILLHDGREGGGNILQRGGFMSLESGPRVAEARSQLIDAFLAGFELTDWLLFLDADMDPPADLVPRLLEVAHPQRAPIVGGLCFAGGRSGRIYPTLYRVTDGETGAMDTIDEWPRGRLVKVDATGAACLLVHRQVLVAMANAYGTQPNGEPNPYPWFVEGMMSKATGAPYGEDIAFCLRVRKLGIPIHVHTGIEVGHRKAQVLDSKAFDLYRSLQGPATLGDESGASAAEEVRDAGVGGDSRAAGGELVDAGAAQRGHGSGAARRDGPRLVLP